MEHLYKIALFVCLHLVFMEAQLFNDHWTKIDVDTDLLGDHQKILKFEALSKIICSSFAIAASSGTESIFCYNANSDDCFVLLENYWEDVRDPQTSQWKCYTTGETGCPREDKPSVVLHGEIGMVDGCKLLCTPAGIIAPPTVPKLYGCNSPFTLLDNTFPCIQIFTAKKTMQDAMIHCRSLGTDLFSTTSESWFNELATHLSTEHSALTFYVGYVRAGSDWQWKGTINRDYPADAAVTWETDYPDSREVAYCGYVEGGKMRNDNCNTEREFVCEAYYEDPGP